MLGKFFTSGRLREGTSQVASPLTPRPSRLVALFTLALLSFGALAESAVLLAYAAGGHPQPLFDSVQWVAVRLAAFSGTACITALVLSRAARR